MRFCPWDGSLLSVSSGASDESGRLAFSCPTCDFQSEITTTIRKRTTLVPKKVDDVMGGLDAWKNSPMQSEVLCDRCRGKGAYYIQIQTRSADEPMTIFYKCIDVADCGHEWREQ